MKTVQVIENIDKKGSEWTISLTDNNPESKDSFVVSDREEAFRIKNMLEKWSNEGGKRITIEEAKSLLAKFWFNGLRSDSCPLECTDAEEQVDEFRFFVHRMLNPNEVLPDEINKESEYLKYRETIGVDK